MEQIRSLSVFPVLCLPWLLSNPNQHQDPPCNFLFLSLHLPSSHLYVIYSQFSRSIKAQRPISSDPNLNYISNTPLRINCSLLYGSMPSCLESCYSTHDIQGYFIYLLSLSVNIKVCLCFLGFKILQSVVNAVMSLYSWCLAENLHIYF